MKIRTLLPHLALTLLIALPLTTLTAADGAKKGDAKPGDAKPGDEKSGKFEERMKEVQKAVVAKRSEGKEAFFGELESQARALVKEFPEQAEPYQMLMAVAQNSPDAKKETLTKEVETKARELLKSSPDKPEPYQLLMAIAQGSSPEKQRALFKELTGDKAPEEIKTAAQAQLTKLEAIGKPLDIKFKALDGREVDLASLKGKVVLVDFWATWCGPCVAEVPHVVEAYNKLHEKGFEIVGISLDRDTDKDKLEAFVKDKKMPWPQYFDGKFWQNSIAQKYGINSIPAMWLVDKKGNLVDMNGRAGLEEKVTKMLAE